MGPPMYVQSVVGQNVDMWCMTVSSNKHTPWYSIYDIHQFLHVSTPRCHAQGVITKV